MSDRHGPSRQGLRDYAGALVFVGAVCVIYPLADLLLNNWPVRAGEMAWRYQFVGMLSQSAITPLIGFAMMGLGATFGRMATTLRLLGWGAYAATLLIVLLTGAFLLDARELQAAVSAQERPVFRLASLRAVLKNLVTLSGFGFLGFAALRAANTTMERDRAISSNLP